jgi:hypothetical protein
MKIIISNKNKKDIFISLFHLLKNCSSTINATFDIDKLHIQGMDKSQVCLFDLTLCKSWFDEYIVLNKTNICLDSILFYSIISIKSDNQHIIMNTTVEEKEDNLNILYVTFVSSVNGEFIDETPSGNGGIKKSKKESTSSEKPFKKTFKLNLLEYEYTQMMLPNAEYDVEFSISSKQVTDIFHQLNNFGPDIQVDCMDNNVVFTTKDITSEMEVEIDSDDFNEYSIVEGEKISLIYSLSYINKMCITNKLSNTVEFFINKDIPMKIQYVIEDSSTLLFFIAPKIMEE